MRNILPYQKKFMYTNSLLADTAILCCYTYLFKGFIKLLLFQLIGTKMKFDGPTTFICNNAETINGGAIFLISFSQIVLNYGAKVDFIDNIGRYVLATCNLCISSYLDLSKLWMLLELL